VELVHNFSLLHDDLMDGDEQRRHRDTVWKVHGPAQPILVGAAAMRPGSDAIGLSLPRRADVAHGRSVRRLIAES
jgi:hypothetical protein